MKLVFRMLQCKLMWLRFCSPHFILEGGFQLVVRTKDEVAGSKQHSTDASCTSLHHVQSFLSLTEPGLGGNSWWCTWWDCSWCQLKQHSVQLEQMAKMSLYHLYFSLLRHLLITVNAEMLPFQAARGICDVEASMDLVLPKCYLSGLSNRLSKFIFQLLCITEEGHEDCTGTGGSDPMQP